MRNIARMGAWAMCVCALMLTRPQPAAGSPISAPWIAQDVGAVGVAGSASLASDVFTVSGAGADIWGAADAFQSVMQPITGDVQIVARVASIQNTNTFAKAGVMIRASLTAGAADVILDVRPNGAIEFMTRSADGGATTWLGGATQIAPAWLRLTRSGATVTASVSADGTSWTDVGSTSTSLAAGAYVGLAVTSHDATRLNTSAFDHVAVTGGGLLPSPWTTQDVGSVGLAGGASYANGVFTVKGSGADIWGTADAFQAVSQPLIGDATVVARVTSVQNTNTFAKAGLMLRDSLAASAAHVVLDVRPNGAIEFMTRSGNGGSTAWLSGASQAAPVWLKLVRSGSTVTGYVSTTGTTWMQVGSTTLTFGATPVAALVVTSHDVTQIDTSTFDNVAVAGALVPAPWTTEDVGSVGIAGSAAYANGVFTTKGAGADIWGNADAFRAVSQPLAGDVQLVARVTGVQNTNTYAKAGLMLRDSPAASAAHVVLDVRPNGSIEFMARSTAGGSTTWLAGATQAAPVWLKLTRAGSLVTGYVSTTGTTWTEVGTATVTFGATPLGALVVTSHDVTQLNTSTFDNVSAGPLPVVVPPPSDVLSGVAVSPLTLSWTAIGATSYDLFFGTTNPPPATVTGLSAASYVLSILQQGVTYFWQVIAHNSSGTTASPTWSFTTELPPPPPPPPPAPPAPLVSTTPAGAPSQYSAITDRVAYPKPPLPQLGPAGYAFNDPTFGSRILRVTDGATRPGLLNRSFRVPSNAHLAAWNATSTHFFVISNDGTIIPYNFDASTMTASRVQPSSSGNGGLTLPFYVEPQFSLVNPDVIYGVGGSNNRTVSAFNFATGVATTLINLDNIVPGLANTYVGGIMTGGVPSETLMTFFGGGGQDYHYYVLWAPLDGSPSKLMNTAASTINGVPTTTTLNFHLHATQIDKSGRYVFLYPSGADIVAPRNAAQVYIWDTATDAITPLTQTMHPAGHDAAGFGVWLNQDCCSSSTWDAAQWQFRSLASLWQTNDLISPVLQPKEVYLADHTTWNNTQPDRLVPVISSTYRYGPNTTDWRAWDDEIIGIDTTNGGGGTVWRFAHHRSDIRSDSNPSVPYFWYEPIANISPDGRWVLFTSNWEKTLGTDAAEGTARQDVFLVQLTPAP